MGQLTYVRCLRLLLERKIKDDLSGWTDDPLYDEGKSLEENIRAIGAYWEEMMTAE